MNKVLQLKIAAMMLFWFGMIIEFIILADTPISYYRYGTIAGELPQTIISNWIHGAMFLTYTLFAHIVHIVAGYWLAKGKRKGIVLGISLSLFEIVPFLAPLNYGIFTPFGMSIRILFAVVILLIVLGRKELVNLQKENWRPWKKPVAPTGSGVT